MSTGHAHPNAVDPNYDYTKEPLPLGADEFELPEAAGFDQSADEIEAERSFRDIPPGEWELMVVGFLAAPKLENPKEVYVNGQRMSYTSHSVVVKLAKADDPGAQVTDFFLLPPMNPNEHPAYFHGAKSPDGKGAGFNAAKFYHFLERLGFAVPKGAPLPPDARKLGNWKGRKIVATVEPGRPYTDQTTGEEKPGRNQTKLFSYRPAGSPVAGASGASGAATNAHTGHAASPKRPSGTGAQQMANAGLENI